MYTAPELPFEEVPDDITMYPDTPDVPPLSLKRFKDPLSESVLALLEPLFTVTSPPPAPDEGPA
jgi:hypothetical protein